MSTPGCPIIELVIVIWLIQVAFDWKHFIADYPLQTNWMLGKFNKKGRVIPLSAHCGVHFLGTALILLGMKLSIGLPTWALIGLSCLDFVIHFTMDRIKASPDLLGRFQTLTKSEGMEIKARKESNSLTPEDKKKLFSNWMFWQSLGLDQLVHHLTHDLIWGVAIL